MIGVSCRRSVGGRSFVDRFSGRQCRFRLPESLFQDLLGVIICVLNGCLTVGLATED